MGENLVILILLSSEERGKNKGESSWLFEETKLRETEGNITHLKYSKYSTLSLASFLVPLSTSTVVDTLTLAE